MKLNWMAHEILSIIKICCSKYLNIYFLLANAQKNVSTGIPNMFPGLKDATFKELCLQKQDSSKKNASFILTFVNLV
jgi:hypothetical protein